MISRRALLLGAACGLLCGSRAGAAGDLRSGPQVGERPLPFTSNLVTGPHRGKQYCYVCELKEDEPAVLVFARQTDEPTARLLRDLRDAVKTHRKEKLFGWFVFLGDSSSASQADLERRIFEFARQNGATTLPVSALGDPLGPPGYLIAPDARVTLLVFRGGKVLANRTYSAGEWTPRAASGALKDLRRLIAPPSAPGR